MSNGSGSAENVRFMSFKCPDTSALSKTSRGHSERQPSTYVLILNKDAENQASNGSSSQHPGQQRQGAQDAINVLKNKSKSRVTFSSNDSLKLNLTNGFDDYDSSSSSQKVFKDDAEEAKDEGFGEATKVIRLKIPSSLQKAMQISQRLNAQRLLAETSTTQQSAIKEQKNSTTKSSSLVESGYLSANSSCLSKESFETPNSVFLPANHQTARKIFYKSSTNLSEGKSLHHSPSYLKPSPISSLSSGLQNVAVFQSSPSFSPSPGGVQSSQSLQRTSTPKSGYVVESKDGQKFVLPVDPQQTKTVSVSKSDSCINIKPLDVAQFLPYSNNKASYGWPTVNNTSASQIHSSKIVKAHENSNFHEGDKAEVENSSEVSNKDYYSANQTETNSSSVFSKEKVGDVVIKYAKLQENENVVKVEVEDKDFSAEIPDSQGSVDDIPDSQESTEKESLNDSLTNIQWLGGMQLKEDGKPQLPATQNKKDTAIQWRCLSHSEVLKIAKEYGRAKRPPFSYMTLIQMALNSREDKRKTLREICKWIEEIFPYYKYTAKPGWKNSIRHNLSLYSIFEREKSKKHGSYWTIREDCPEKSKVVPSKEKKDVPTSLSNYPVFLPHQAPRIPKLPIPPHHKNNLDGLKRSLQPILPRPHSYGSPLQTFALIPIQSMNQPQGMSSTQGQPMLIQVPSNPPPLSQDIKKESDASLNTEKGDKKIEHNKKKVITIAPKISSPNIVEQAWINAQSLSDNEKRTEIIGNTDTVADLSAKRKKQNNGLPKPRIYPQSSPQKKQRSRRKQKLVPKERDLLNDSSDDNEDDVKKFINKLEQDLPTPLRAILDSNEPDKVTTSTPMKNTTGSPELPSPIKGITPLKGVSLLDSSFLDGFKDLEDGKNPFGSPNFMLSMKKMSPSLMCSPSASQFDNLFSGLTPIKGDLNSSNNENLSRILSEFPLDGIESEDEMLTNNLSNMNWSAICQNINSTPSGKN
ncbi:forkhead box protein M1-like isoform X2 [Saccostrea echinata]|uniref:forkhead box protein M1-like isoform X2 n=1 Tax=Saccostrea echinata TaxID=191078 RepID=UPI002A80249B|nr:forkhead box protein M1-like isoform X2 [Saccostrea echinata]